MEASKRRPSKKAARTATHAKSRPPRPSRAATAPPSRLTRQFAAAGQLRRGVLPAVVWGVPRAATKEAAPPKPLNVLCVHGVGHAEADVDAFHQQWQDAIASAVQQVDPQVVVQPHFAAYDDLFANAPLNPVTVGEALVKLGGSGISTAVNSVVTGVESAVGGIVHGIGGLFHPSRGLTDLPDELRWTAGMVAQWAADAQLRQASRDRIKAVLAQMDADGTPADIILAHSLGTLVCYDLFSREPALLANKTFVVFGSQIANPFVKGTFGGYIQAFPDGQGTDWYQLYNPNDHVFTAEIRLSADNFHEVITSFSAPPLNHDATQYLDHPNAVAGMWQPVIAARTGRDLTASDNVTRAFAAAAGPRGGVPRRALLIGINDYPDPANHLDGCINDCFAYSAALQESGFLPEEIRAVFDERATTDGIIERLHWLLDGVCAGDQRVLCVSCHGAQLPTYDVTGKVSEVHSCIVPYDFNWTPEHAITDEVFATFYSQLPYEAHFLAILDCCHSGGMARGSVAKVRGINPPDDVRHRMLQWDWADQMWVARRSPDAEGGERAALRAQGRPPGPGQGLPVSRLGNAEHLRRYAPERLKTVAEEHGHVGPYKPIVIQACGADQLSYEYRHGVTSYGAFTFALTTTLSRERRQTTTGEKELSFKWLVDSAKKTLTRVGFPEQTPELDGPKEQLGVEIPFKPITEPAAAKAG